MTAAYSGPPILAERADIHKSCKAIETLLNVLDDYGQVVSAMATLEKRLAKALRELAGLKVTNDIAANTFNVSANVFEALADISGKLAKITDKEYDGIGTEVRKWFKRLAKEEKAHDERLSSANTRIKQAGQAYEKKSKKNTRDAAEEHARYINLVSTLGPEISKDKYDHGVTLTRLHISTTYSVAACLARIADAEWLRTCESIRRFSPNIGPLGEWRALCEGGWDRPLPPELPDIGTAETDRNLVEYRVLDGRPDVQRAKPAEVNGGPTSYPVNNLVDSPIQSQTTSSSYARSDTVYILSSTSESLNSRSLQPPRPSIDPNTGSVRSLSEFPTPPGHFPIPPPQSVSFQSDSGLNPNNLPPNPSPLGEDEESSRADTPTQDLPVTPGASDQGEASQQSTESIRDAATSESTKATELGGTSINSSSSSGFVAAMRHRYTKSLGTNSPQPKDIPRLPTSVADLATRYQSPEPPASPSHPRRPSLLIRRQNNAVSVVRTDESQYLDDAISEQSQQHDPRDRECQLLERERELELRVREIDREREELVKVRRDMSKQTSGPPEASGLSAFAQQLLPRARERRVSLRRQQQEQSDSPLLSKRANIVESPTSSTYHTAYSPSQPAPASPTFSSSAQQGHHPFHSRHSQQSLLGPSHPAQSTNSPGISKPFNPSHNPQGSDLPSNRGLPHPKPQGRDPHPPYCGCERCLAKYSESSNPDAHALRPPEQPISLRPETSSSSGSGGGGLFSSKRSGTSPNVQQATEKSKGGWMRRLSMPVVMGHALNLDSSSSKKNSAQRESSSSSSLYALGAGIGNTPLPSPGAKGGRFPLDGRKNVSSTNLKVGGNTGINVREDGKIARRSYEANVLANRSMTNLGQSGRR